MGILNLTPDSFSDGGKIQNQDQFIQIAEQMLQNGAQLLDIGAESSGPNSHNVSEDEEANRLFPYLKELVKLKQKYKFQISIDTYKANIAHQALTLGTDLINDITAFRGDPKMISVLEKFDCKIIIMYSKDPTARTTKTATEYQDIMETIINFFKERIEFAEANGINRNRLILDPGMGAFISTIADYSFEILERLPELKAHFNLPILIGTSRKSMHPFPLEDRLIPSISTALLASFNGADILRVHDVAEHYQALRTFSN
jgi:dihydropteroate synthase